MAGSSCSYSGSSKTTTPGAYPAPKTKSMLKPIAYKPIGKSSPKR